MTRVRDVVAWAVFVPAGSVLIGAGVMAAAPGAIVFALGLVAWKLADHLLRRPAVPLVTDDAWRAYLEHPSAVGYARRVVRGGPQ